MAAIIAEPGAVLQDFDSVTAGTSGTTLTLAGIVYSNDAEGDVVAVDTIDNITGYLPSLGSGNGLSGAYNGVDASATYFQFASENNADNFKILSFNAQVFGHSSLNSEIYTITGYDNGVVQASATVNFRVGATYGSGVSTIIYTRLTTAQEIIDSLDGSNCGTLSFTGSGWANVDQVRMTVADAAPNTFMTVTIDNLATGEAEVANTAPTDIMLSNSSVTQSGGANAVVGSLSTTDADSSDIHEYSLVSGTGDADNDDFNISGANLRASDAASMLPGNYFVRVRTDDANGGTYTESFTITVVDDVAPVVTDANISISGGSGTAGAFRIGDTVTATWNNAAGGDNNSDTITSVTVDFSQFGGGTAVTASDISGTWTATYTMVAGAVDAQNRNVAVTATDNAANATTTADSTNATVDNAAPAVTDAFVSISGASGTGGAFRLGDTITAAWNNTAEGDNNSDTISAVTVNFSQFGGETAVSASNDSGTWTATYTLVAESTSATGLNVAIRAVDNAGNTTTTVDSTGATVDVIPPQVLSIKRKAPATQLVREAPVVFEVTFSEDVTSVAASSFAVTAVNGGSVTGEVTSISGGPKIYDVTVGITAGTGEFRLDAVE